MFYFSRTLLPAKKSWQIVLIWALQNKFIRFPTELSAKKKFPQNTLPINHFLPNFPLCLLLQNYYRKKYKQANKQDPDKQTHPQSFHHQILYGLVSLEGLGIRTNSCTSGLWNGTQFLMCGYVGMRVCVYVSLSPECNSCLKNTCKMTSEERARGLSYEDTYSYSQGTHTILIRSRYIPYENTVLVRSRYPRKMRRTQRSQLWLAATIRPWYLYESTPLYGRSTLGKYVAPIAVNH